MVVYEVADRLWGAVIGAFRIAVRRYGVDVSDVPSVVRPTTV
jgi:hypothetical protein